MILPSPNDCQSCDCPPETQVPGPQGPAGADGTNGTDGRDPISETTASFVVPAVGDNVTISVDDNFWMLQTQPVYIQNAGTYQVQNTSGSASVTIKNLGYTSPSGDNAPPGTTIPSSSRIAPSGWRGVDGALTGAAGGSLAGNYPNPTIAAGAVGASEINNSIKDAAGATPSLRTLGTGGAQAAAGNDSRLSDSRIPTGAAGGSLAGSYPNPTISASGVSMGSYGGPDAIPQFTTGTDGRLTAAANAATNFRPRYGLIGSKTAVDLNVATSDNAITVSSTRYRIDRVTVEAATINTTTATAGLFTAAGGGGTTLAADQALSDLSAPTKFKDLSLQTVVGTDVTTAGTLYFRVGTPQGAADTANVWIWGWIFDL